MSSRFLFFLIRDWRDEDVVYFTCAACKLAQVQIFRQRLIERGRRKWIAREYGLIQSTAGMAKKKTVMTGTRKQGPNEDQ